MATIDLENAVIQGWSRDIETDDWSVEANNLEVVLGDNSGGTTFTVRDINNVGVAEIDSDGYLSVLGDAEVHGGHVLINAATNGLTNTEFLTLKDLVDQSSVFLFDADPNGIISGTKGSIGLNYTDGYAYVNFDDATLWRRLVVSNELDDLEGAINLHHAYKNHEDGGNAEIVTDGTDGSVVIAGTQTLKIIADGGLDLDSAFDMDATDKDFTIDLTNGTFSVSADEESDITVTGANIIFQTVTSGDIINRLPATDGDFVIDEGSGIEYLRAETLSNELKLGNTTSTAVDVRVLSNLIVDGDLTVDGLTTTINTEEMYVEDRLVRLNVGSAPSFNGTVGIEAEVGSDGYVEFHWDDNDGRWEFSIDRNTTPETQTFRPIPYLADSPNTLDLSDVGNDNYPTDGPNPSGASVINTNHFNFPDTFGPYMDDDSVQAALEAIDGYFRTNITDAIINLDEYITQVEGDLNTHISDTTIHFTESEIDHGSISGLDDQEDHPSYLTRDGTRTLTAPWDSQNEIIVTALGVLDVNADGYVYLHDAGDAATPNTTSGAYAIGTNSENYSDTFGPDMTSDSVQGALEAIDGYLQGLISGDINVTLHSAYKRDTDGADAIITTDSTDGALVIAGTEKLQVTATGGFDLDTGFDMDGTDSFDVEVTNAPFSIDGYNVDSNVSVDSANLVVETTTSGDLWLNGATDANITAGDVVTVDGANGIVLDSNGSNVTPSDSCTDSLGDSTHGWTDIYLCDGSNNVVSLGASGGSAVANTTSGAYVVGTNSDNFFQTFGPDMTSNTVQAALEAIDGYLKDLFSEIEDNSDITLQEVFDNSVVGGEVLLDLGDNNWHIDGGNSDVTFELTDGYFAVNTSDHVTLISEGDVNVHGGNDVNITSEGDTILNGDNLDVNVTSSVTIDSDSLDINVINDIVANAENVTVHSNNNTNINSDVDTIINGGDDVEIIAGDDFNVNVGGDVAIEADGYVELDGNSIVLDSNGGNVTPATSCTDSLGDSTHGWTDIYLCDGSNNVIGLGDAGDTSTANETSGANLVGTNSSNFETFGGDMGENSVQAALEAIDGYLKDLTLEDLDTTYIKTGWLDINGCVLNGVGKIHTSAGTPGLDFKQGGTSRASWSMPVPSDWDGVSDIEVEVIWSPATSGAGDVAWRLEYKSLALTELASSAATNDDYAQATGGTADGVQSTEDNLAIPAAAISANDDIIVINIVRRGNAAADTYNRKAYVHLVKYNYVAQNIV
jgi:hypothetical protein